jgi:hypothetical protein
MGLLCSPWVYPRSVLNCFSKFSQDLKKLLEDFSEFDINKMSIKMVWERVLRNLFVVLSVQGYKN